MSMLKDEALEESTLKWAEPDARDRSISCVIVAATHTVFSSRKEMVEWLVVGHPESQGTKSDWNPLYVLSDDYHLILIQFFLIASLYK